jgi:hypothetical protein
MNWTKWSGGAGADAANAVRGITQLEALMKGYKNNLTPQEWEEAGIAYTRVLSGNRPASEQIRAIVPQTLVGNAMKVMQWFSNDPTGTQQQAFAKRMLTAMAREKDVNMGIIKGQQLAASQDVRKTWMRHPVEARQAFEANGLTAQDVAAKDPELAKAVWGNVLPKPAAPAPAAPADVPQVGQTFNGAKVLRVTRIK